MEKKKKKEFLLYWAGGRVFGPPGRAYGPAAAHERGGDGAARESDGVTAGPLASESGGETALRPDGAGEPAERAGEKAGRR